MVFDVFDKEFETCSGRRCHIGFVAVVKVYSLIAKFRGIGFFLVDDFLVPKSLPNCDPKITWLVMKKPPRNALLSHRCQSKWYVNLSDYK